MNDYHRCQHCGSKVGSMQVHSTEVCERAQQAAGLPPPWPLKEWPKEPPKSKLEDLLARR